jgi:hypothetical protein
MELTGNATGEPAANAPPGSGETLLSALAGTEARRECEVAERTRRVVLASLGVMQEQKAGRKRGRALAMASILLVLVALGPFFWRLVDDLISGEHILDLAPQFSLLILVLCPAVLAAVLVAGWTRR